MKVIAVDPGKTSGIAVWENRGLEEFFSAWYADRWETLDVVENTDRLGVLVVEKFSITARTAKLSWEGSYVALELIGALRWLCWKRGTPFVLQAPADALSFVTDEKLRALGWYAPGPDHPRDATRHLVLYLVNNGLMDPRRVIPSP